MGGEFTLAEIKPPEVQRDIEGTVNDKTERRLASSSVS
jgi:hypothetical protein